MKYVLFDLDGTLTDPKEGITKSVDYALNHFGIETDNLDDLCKFIGPPLKDSFCDFYGLSEENAEIAIAKYRERFASVGLFENKEYDGIDELLKTLVSKGKTLIVATSKPTVYAEKILAHFDLLKYFDYVAGSNLDGTRVKKSEVIAHALKENNITDLDDVIMVGDRKHDVLGAKEIGVKSVGVLYGYGDLDEHKMARADFISSDVSTLYEILL